MHKCFISDGGSQMQGRRQRGSDWNRTVNALYVDKAAVLGKRQPLLLTGW
jgi:hypothetical protein